MARIPGPRAMRGIRRHTDPGHPGPVRSPSSLPPVDADKVMVAYRTRIITIRYSQNIILISPANNGWSEAHSGHKVQIMPSSGQYLFVNLRRHPVGRPLSYSNGRQLVTAIGDRAGIAGLHPHMLRHTHATALARAGWTGAEIAARLGHQHASSADV